MGSARGLKSLVGFEKGLEQDPNDHMLFVYRSPEMTCRLLQKRLYSLLRTKLVILGTVSFSLVFQGLRRVTEEFSVTAVSVMSLSALTPASFTLSLRTRRLKG